MFQCTTCGNERQIWRRRKHENFNSAKIVWSNVKLTSCFSAVLVAMHQPSGEPRKKVSRTGKGEKFLQQPSRNKQTNQQRVTSSPAKEFLVSEQLQWNVSTTSSFYQLVLLFFVTNKFRERILWSYVHALDKIINMLFFIPYIDIVKKNIAFVFKSMI